MRKKFVLFATVVTLFSTTPTAYPNIYKPTQLGAIPDGKTLNTAVIQQAIDKANSHGGGTVLLDSGVFVSGTIFLKSNVTLHIAAGATLLGSPRIEDYTELTWGHNVDRQPYHLIVADNAQNITIEGKGTIDGNGEYFWEEYERNADGNMVIPRWIKAKKLKVSPLIEITRSQNIYIHDVTIKTGGGWNLHLFDCDVAKIHGVNIINNLYSPNSDGIDITGCNDIIISDCYIKTCDDAICLKTTPDSRSCHRVTVTNCVIETLCVALKLGCTESSKDITDVTFNNCVVNKSSRAVMIGVRDGATYDRIAIINIVANTNAPLVFNRPIQILVNKLNPDSKAGTVRNVLISNFICETEGRILLTSAEGGLIENVILRDIVLRYPMIESPQRYIGAKVSSQFPKPTDHPEAVTANAALVAENIKNLVIENMIVDWPLTDSTPINWQHPERIENGTSHIHKPDYTKARQTEFSAIWARNVQGGYFRTPLLKSSSKTKPVFDIKKSNIKIL
ncbi:MAG TPA: glycosyl hydrolase family 28 protein [Paludibacteraceae bacterium]|nr:glycosyl hydrolase family 28 protein [Paludibacteraceae bacterium]HOK99762.1 glycosyl hydrolase family 28 protein [Bacteroidales bacterium]HON01621.1 glycosyl hydrolase family 28 protein [Paludibacteraceae bacterium]HPD59664.1 glycosyl hydrolase family 28 protein [Paludibacteraceae bacterium]HPQ11886.1 glycosyl hydrolase family 28 protein [Paludibacteraceae bacterium]